jgi:hypothetical protein
MKTIAVGLIRFYQVILSPLKTVFFGQTGTCRFYPTCSCYAMEAVEHHGVIFGAFLTLKRLLRCHPWCPGGVDPVPRRMSNTR